MKKIILTVFILIFTPVIFAADLHYAMIIDAGSSGSRLHLFQYNVTASVPTITDVFSENVKPGLASYEKNPQDAGRSLKKLLDDVVVELNKRQVDSHTVTLNILATAGMRLLPEETQQAIYTDITNYIKQNYVFTLGEVKTITGKMEGLYDWLDINYLTQNFQKHTPTVGAIDVGGASTQIAFATEDTSKSEDEISLSLDGQSYRVFSKSFLGLGLDQARAEINKIADANVCYPRGYSISQTEMGNFNYHTCHVLYSKLIKQHQVSEQLLPEIPQSFIAFSGAYYMYSFFGVDKTPYHVAVVNSIRTMCNQTWEKLKNDYPTTADTYLSSYCANGVYVDKLLHSTYKLQGTQLTVVGSIDQQSIDWTLGAMLYSLLK